MHAAVLGEFGAAPRFELFDEPEPNDDEVLVHVSAAAVTPLARHVASDPDYAGGRTVPFVCGTEGVGRLPDGTRVSFGARRAPFGSMAERAVASKAMLFPVPDAVSDVDAAALFNPALSVWIPLCWRMPLRPGSSVLVLGATGIAGRVAVQTCKLLGADRVVAAGRDPAALAALPKHGADATIDLSLPDKELADAFLEHAGYDVVLDYVWGRPAEVLLDSLPRALNVAEDVRFFQLGTTAGADITLSGNGLRRAGVTVVGSGTFPPLEVVKDLYRRFMDHAGRGELTVDTETAGLPEVEEAWRTVPRRRRLVVVP